MKDFFNINNDKWLGGVNVHNTITIALLAYLVYKLR
jgi:hypothetical protein